MPKPFLSPSLAILRSEVDAKWPNRNKSADGWIGDVAHANRKSDHNPDSRGMVHAIDITIANSTQGRAIRDAVLEATIEDDRVWYVIYSGKIYSKTHGWAPRKYTGPNPHSTHIHVSGDYNKVDENSRKGWLKNSVTYTVRRGDSLSTIAEKFDTTWQQLHKLNPQIGSNPNVLSIGTTLKIG